jgi:hypothetical protein
MEFAPRMDFDFEPSRGFEIEGRIERPFLEIEIGDTKPMTLPAVIAWPTARLRFEEMRTSYSVPVGPFGAEVPANLYTGELDYVDRNNKIKTIELSTLSVDQKPIYFVGSQNGFYAHDPEMIGRNKPFYIIGVQPDELKNNLRRIVAIYHELGHVFIFANNHDISLVQAALIRKRADVPPLNGGLSYAQNLVNEIQYNKIPANFRVNNRYQLAQFESQYPEIGEAVSLFHERYAWAGGGRLMLHFSLPSGYQEATSFTKYAKFCLGTYAKVHRDDRFVDGFISL